MGVYYAILGWILYLGLLKALTRKYEHAETALLLPLSLALFLCAALRGTSVGADTWQYCAHFLSIAETAWADLPHHVTPRFGGVEIGYAVYNKLLSAFGHQQTITVVNSLLLILFVSILIFRDSANRYLSFFLYFTFCFFQTALNFTPSSIVSYAMFLTFPLIRKRKLVPFLLCIAVGMCFHLSAMFFLPMYWLGQLPFRRKTALPVLAAGGGIAVFYLQCLPYLLFFVPTVYRHYLDDTSEHTGYTVELLVYAVQLLAVLFCVLTVERKDRPTMYQKNQIALWAFVTETIFYALSVRSSMFSRGAFLYSPYTVLLIPNILREIRDERKRKRVTLLLILYGVAAYLARTRINNVGKTIPYEFFFGT